MTSPVWHPYTQHGLNPDILEVVSAEGAYFTLKDGRKILDAISSWWVNLHGHSHPKIAEAIGKQAAEMEHVLFAGFTHEPAVKLADLLVSAMKERKTSLSKVFYSDNGSTAVETALKLAYQYHLNRGDMKRRRFISLRGGYHGDTLGAMSVSDPSGFHAKFKDLFPPVDFTEPDDIEALKNLLDHHEGEHCALIVEPLVQGASGMKIYSAAFLKGAAELCKARGILLICDEVFTGFYRTGTFFAFEHAGIRPDLVCLSKGLTGGFLPFAATLCTEDIYSAFLSDSLREAFLHGHSYTANPIGCAAALASWELLHEAGCQERIRRISEITRRETERLSSHPNVAGVRSLGTIGAVDLKGESGYFAKAGRAIGGLALERGVLLRPLGNVLYAVPPYCVTDDEMVRIYRTMSDVIDRMEPR